MANLNDLFSKFFESLFPNRQPRDGLIHLFGAEEWCPRLYKKRNGYLSSDGAPPITCQFCKTLKIHELQFNYQIEDAKNEIDRS